MKPFSSLKFFGRLECRIIRVEEWEEAESSKEECYKLGMAFWKIRM